MSKGLLDIDELERIANAPPKQAAQGGLRKVYTNADIESMSSPSPLPPLDIDELERIANGKPKEPEPAPPVPVSSQPRKPLLMATQESEPSRKLELPSYQPEPVQKTNIPSANQRQIEQQPLVEQPSKKDFALGDLIRSWGTDEGTLKAKLPILDARMSVKASEARRRLANPKLYDRLMDETQAGQESLSDVVWGTPKPESFKPRLGHPEDVEAYAARMTALKGWKEDARRFAQMQDDDFIFQFERFRRAQQKGETTIAADIASGLADQLSFRIKMTQPLLFGALDVYASAKDRMSPTIEYDEKTGEISKINPALEKSWINAVKNAAISTGIEYGTEYAGDFLAKGIRTADVALLRHVPLKNRAVVRTILRPVQTALQKTGGAKLVSTTAGRIIKDIAKQTKYAGFTYEMIEEFLGNVLHAAHDPDKQYVYPQYIDEKGKVPHPLAGKQMSLYDRMADGASKFFEWRNLLTTGGVIALPIAGGAAISMIGAKQQPPGQAQPPPLPEEAKAQGQPRQPPPLPQAEGEEAPKPTKNAVQRAILAQSGIPKPQMADYVGDQLADGERLGKHAEAVLAGQETVEQAAEAIAQDWTAKDRDKAAQDALERAGLAEGTKTSAEAHTPEAAKRGKPTEAVEPVSEISAQPPKVAATMPPVQAEAVRPEEAQVKAQPTPVPEASKLAPIQKPGDTLEKAPELMTPEEYAESGRTIGGDVYRKHSNAILAAITEDKPINAEAAERYGWQPEKRGYVRQADRYVYQPQDQAQKPGDTLEGTNEDFVKAVEQWKQKYKRGEITVEELGKRMASFKVKVEEPAISSAPERLNQKPEIAQIIETFESGNDDRLSTVSDVVDAVSKLDDIPLSIQDAIAEYRASKQEDFRELGMRGDVEAYEEKVMQALRNQPQAQGEANAIQKDRTEQVQKPKRKDVQQKASRTVPRDTGIQEPAAQAEPTAKPEPVKETRTPFQILEQEKAVTLKLPPDVLPKTAAVRITMPGRSMVQSKADVEAGSLFEVAGITKIEAGNKLSSGKFIPVKGTVGVTVKAKEEVKPKKGKPKKQGETQALGLPSREKQMAELKGQGFGTKAAEDVVEGRKDRERGIQKKQNAEPTEIKTKKKRKMRNYVDPIKAAVMERGGLRYHKVDPSTGKRPWMKEMRRLLQFIRPDGLAFDQMWQQLHDNKEIDFDWSQNDLYEHLVSRRPDGKPITEESHYEQVADEYDAWLATESETIHRDQLKVGDTFNIRGDPFRVTEENDTSLTIQDGETFYLPFEATGEDAEIRIDKGSLNSVESEAKAEEEEQGEPFRLEQVSAEELKAEQTKQEQQEKIRKLQEKPLTAEGVDTTGDLFERQDLFQAPSMMERQKAQERKVSDEQQQENVFQKARRDVDSEEARLLAGWDVDSGNAENRNLAGESVRRIGKALSVYSPEWENVEADTDFLATDRYQEAQSQYALHGFLLIPIKDKHTFYGARISDKIAFVATNEDNFEAVSDHELFHLLVNYQNPHAVKLMGMVKRDSPAFLRFKRISEEQGMTDQELIVEEYVALTIQTGLDTNAGVEGQTLSDGYTSDPTETFQSLFADETDYTDKMGTRGAGIKYAIMVFHGTPHTFEPEPGFPMGRVRKEKVGTGEGAAAYGWGILYGAESLKVADSYRRSLSSRPVPSPAYERFPDRVSADAEQFAQLAVSHSGVVKSLSLGDVVGRDKDAAMRGRVAMLPVMRRLIQDDQIRRAVIRLTPVDVMDVLSGEQATTEDRLHNDTVLIDALSVAADDPISVQAEAVDKLAPVLARAIAVHPRVHPDLARRLFDAFPAEGTSSIHGGNIPYPREDVKPGNIYRVELNFDPEDTLDWDRPFSEQSEKVRTVVQQWPSATATGADYYQRLVRMQEGVDRPSAMQGFAARAASEYLSSLGIKGIRYADQGSRLAEDVEWVKDVLARLHEQRQFAIETTDAGPTLNNRLAEIDKEIATNEAALRQTTRTYNYVVFREEDIRVIDRNGDTISASDAVQGPKYSSKAIAEEYERAPVTAEQDAAYLAAVERGDAYKVVELVSRFLALNNTQKARLWRDVREDYLERTNNKIEPIGKSPWDSSSARLAGKKRDWIAEMRKAFGTTIRDDAGNVIPLSKRFNEKTPDIRFSLADVADKWQNNFYESTPTTGADTEADNAVRELNRVLAENTEPGTTPPVFQAVEPRWNERDTKNPSYGRLGKIARREIERIFRKRIVFIDGPSSFGGANIGSLPTSVFVHVRGKQPWTQVVGHELFHAMKQDAPALYQELSEELRRNMAESEATQGAAMVEMAAGGAQGVDNFIVERMADLVGEHMSEQEFWQNVSQTNPSLWQRIMAFIDKFLAKIQKQLATSPLRKHELFSNIADARKAIQAVIGKYAQERQGAETTPDIRYSRKETRDERDTTKTEIPGWTSDGRIADLPSSEAKLIEDNERFAKGYIELLRASGQRMSPGMARVLEEPQGFDRGRSCSTEGRRATGIAESLGFRIVWMDGIGDSRTNLDNKLILVDSEEPSITWHEMTHALAFNDPAIVSAIDTKSEAFQGIKRACLADKEARMFWRGQAIAILESRKQRLTEKAIDKALEECLAENLLADIVAGTERTDVDSNSYVKDWNPIRNAQAQFGTRKTAEPRYSAKATVERYAGAERPRLLGLRKSIAQKEREILGLPPEARLIARHFPDVWQEAWDRKDEIPTIIKDLQENPRPFASDTEVAMLTIEQIQRRNALDRFVAAEELAKEEGDPIKLEQAKKNTNVALRSYNEILDLASSGEQKPGTLTARALSALRMVADSEFNLGHMERTLRDIKGEDLSKEELAELRELKRQYDADKIKWEAERKAAQERQEELETELREQSFSTAVSDLIKDVMREYGPGNRRKFAEPVKAQAKQEAASARDFLKSKVAQMRQAQGIKYAKKPEVQLDPDMLSAVSSLVFERITDGQINFTDIENRLVKDIGPEVRPYMRQAYEEALRRAIKADNDFKAREAIKDLNTKKKQRKPEEKEKETKTEEEEKAAERSLVRQLFRDQIEQGKREREDILDGVMEVINGGLPEGGPGTYTRDQIKQILTRYGESFELARTEVDKILSDITAQIRVGQQLADVARKQAPKPTGAKRTKPSQITRELIRKLHAEMKKAGIKLQTDAEHLASAMDTIKRRLSNQIEDLQKALDSKTKLVLNKEQLEYDQEAKDLKAERDSLRELYDQMFPKEPISDEQRLVIAIKAAERSEAQWKQILTDAIQGKFEKKAQGKPLPESLKLNEIKARRDEARAEVKRLKDLQFPPKSPEQRSIENWIKRRKNMKAELERRMAQEDYEPKKKAEVDISNSLEALEANAQLELTKAKYTVMKADYLWRKAGKFKKALIMAGVLSRVQASIKSAFDASAILRHGGVLALSHPIIAARNIVPAFRAYSRINTMKMMAEFRNRANYRNGTYQKMKLAINEDDRNGNFKEVENQYNLDIAGYIPGVKISNRMFAMYMNLIRADFADHLLSTIPKEQRTAEELKAIGSDVNIWTGRSSLGNKAKGLSTVLWAPSLLKAGFDIVTLRPILWHGTARSKKMFAKEYAKATGSLIAIYSIAALIDAIDPDDDFFNVEWDPRSAAFGAIHIGNHTINPIPFFRPLLTLLARVSMNSYKNPEGELMTFGEGGNEMLDALTRFVVSKLHPTIGTGISIAQRKMLFSNKPVTFARLGFDAFAPLSIQQAWQSFQIDEPGIAAPLSLISALGADVKPDYTKEAVIMYEADTLEQYKTKLSAHYEKAESAMIQEYLKGKNSYDSVLSDVNEARNAQMGPLHKLYRQAVAHKYRLPSSSGSLPEDLKRRIIARAQKKFGTAKPRVKKYPRLEKK